MTLAQLRDYIESLSIADTVYAGMMPGMETKSIGVYRSRHEREYQTAIGGHDLASYGIYSATFLIHWNKSPVETEGASMALFEAIRRAREVSAGNSTIKFIQPLVDAPVNVGTDDNGIFERVIEAAVYYKKGD